MCFIAHLTDKSSPEDHGTLNHLFVRIGRSKAKPKDDMHVCQDALLIVFSGSSYLQGVRNYRYNQQEMNNNASYNVMYS